MEEREEEAIGDSHWLNWCRLCGSKDDISGNVKIYTNEKETTWNSVLVLAIRKYFDVHMQVEDELGAVLCKECYTLISELIDFAEHVTKVQAIFEVLRRSEPNNQLDMEALRLQYGLREGNWTHIIKPVPEIENNNAGKLERDMSPPIDKEEEEEVPKQEETVNRLPIEEILVAGWDANEDAQERRNPKRLSTDDRPRNLQCKEEEEEQEEDEPDIEINKLSADADQEFLPEAATLSVPFEDSLDCSSRNEDTESEHNTPGVLPRTKRSTMECSWCGKLYHNRASYLKHLRLVCRKTEQRPKLDKNTFCELCNKTLSSAAALKLHREGMHENAKPFVCDHCGKQLKTKTALNEHKLVHTEDRPFSCTICKAGFKNRARLKVHYQIHEEPSYVCNICGKKLQTQRTWNMHKLVHSEERKFKCDVCGALFKRSKTLKTHLLSHTGLRPYICNYCGQTFACNANCRAHKLKKHSQELKKEEGAGLSSRLSVPTLDELRVMSQKIPKVKEESNN
ncbi:zinc finger protein weckle [Drosophila grimshawi]|uniref:GH22495 n=1 Tax=Drosophila grimshawi TaxID=7222 RepID=B4JSI8_DROGR|nr:zinc finger protein weckle [Drosophila grimshawi]EDV94728.1 GH22495 [Drosophila grimshawi]